MEMVRNISLVRKVRLEDVCRVGLTLWNKSSSAELTIRHTVSDKLLPDGSRSTNCISAQTRSGYLSYL